MTTADLSDFGYRELDIAADLLKAYCSSNKNLHHFDHSDGIQLMMNQNSGNVFLTNAEHQVAMLNDDTLEDFYSTPYDGHDGFWDELVEEYTEMPPEDQKYMRDIAYGRKLPELEGMRHAKR